MAGRKNVEIAITEAVKTMEDALAVDYTTFVNLWTNNIT